MSGIQRLLVISLGNPGGYRGTYHSAGHFVLESLQKRLQQQPSFSSEKWGKKNSRSSDGIKYALLQSPTLMNVSGPWVARAYKDYLAQKGLSPAECGLVLVHDELEEDLGVVKIRQWNKSHRGHNGVKSVLASLQASEGVNMARVCIGIGRPTSREQSAVSDYVLSQMSSQAKSILDEKASIGLEDALQKLEKKWLDELAKKMKEQ